MNLFFDEINIIENNSNISMDAYYKILENNIIEKIEEENQKLILKK